MYISWVRYALTFISIYRKSYAYIPLLVLLLYIYIYISTRSAKRIECTDSKKKVMKKQRSQTRKTEKKQNQQNNWSKDSKQIKDPIFHSLLAFHKIKKKSPHQFLFLGNQRPKYFSGNFYLLVVAWLTLYFNFKNGFNKNSYLVI